MFCGAITTQFCFTYSLEGVTAVLRGLHTRLCIYLFIVVVVIFVVAVTVTTTTTMLLWRVVVKPPLGGACSAGDVCRDVNAECDVTSGRCQCRHGYQQVNNVCSK